jgi:dihydrolipoamide dehydrogenase
VTVHHNADLEYLKVVDDMVEYKIKYKGKEKTETIRVEKALISIGRVPAIQELGLEKLGIKIVRGRIENQQCTTSVPNIFTAGDTTGEVALVSTAEIGNFI